MSSRPRPATGRATSASWRPPSSHASRRAPARSEEHTSELQSLMRHSYAVFCLKKKKNNKGQQQRVNQLKQIIISTIKNCELHNYDRRTTVHNIQTKIHVHTKHQH